MINPPNPVAPAVISPAPTAPPGTTAPAGPAFMAAPATPLPPVAGIPPAVRLAGGLVTMAGAPGEFADSAVTRDRVALLAKFRSLSTDLLAPADQTPPAETHDTCQVQPDADPLLALRKLPPHLSPEDLREVASLLEKVLEDTQREESIRWKTFRTPRGVLDYLEGLERWGIHALESYAIPNSSQRAPSDFTGLALGRLLVRRHEPELKSLGLKFLNAIPKTGPADYYDAALPDVPGMAYSPLAQAVMVQSTGAENPSYYHRDFFRALALLECAKAEPDQSARLLAQAERLIRTGDVYVKFSELPRVELLLHALQSLLTATLECGDLRSARRVFKKTAALMDEYEVQYRRMCEFGRAWLDRVETESPESAGSLAIAVAEQFRSGILPGGQNGVGLQMRLYFHEALAVYQQGGTRAKTHLAQTLTRIKDDIVYRKDQLSMLELLDLLRLIGTIRGLETETRMMARLCIQRLTHPREEVSDGDQRDALEIFFRTVEDGAWDHASREDLYFELVEKLFPHRSADWIRFWGRFPQTWKGFLGFVESHHYPRVEAALLHRIACVTPEMAFRPGHPAANNALLSGMTLVAQFIAGRYPETTPAQPVLTSTGNQNTAKDIDMETYLHSHGVREAMAKREWYRGLLTTPSLSPSVEQGAVAGLYQAGDLSDYLYRRYLMEYAGATTVLRRTFLSLIHKLWDYEKVEGGPLEDYFVMVLFDHPPGYPDHVRDFFTHYEAWLSATRTHTPWRGDHTNAIDLALFYFKILPALKLRRPLSVDDFLSELSFALGYGGERGMVSPKTYRESLGTGFVKGSRGHRQFQAAANSFRHQYQELEKGIQRSLHLPKAILDLPPLVQCVIIWYLEKLPPGGGREDILVDLTAPGWTPEEAFRRMFECGDNEPVGQFLTLMEGAVPNRFHAVLKGFRSSVVWETHEEILEAGTEVRYLNVHGEEVSEVLETPLRVTVKTLTDSRRKQLIKNLEILGGVAHDLRKQASRFGISFDPVSAYKDFAKALRQEMDFRGEMRKAQAQGRCFENLSGPNVVIMEEEIH